jgi:hypothetical protein
LPKRKADPSGAATGYELPSRTLDAFHTELERVILSIRRWLQVHSAPATPFCLIEATAIRADLEALGVRPLSSGRTTSAGRMSRLPHVR